MTGSARQECAVNDQDEDFSRMLEASLQAKPFFEEGETVEGIIVAIRADVAFVDVGGKGEATIDVEELRDPEGDIEVEVGDRIEAVVVSTAGGLRLSRKLARGAATRRQLEDAFRSGLPVEGKVDKVVKGGFEVRIAGQRAFCPISQIDIVRNTEASEHEGRVYTFRILEFKDGGKNLVVSRRALLEEEQRERAEEVRRSIVAGATVAGRVVSVREYGAFVDLGAGVQGLLHVSEMGWSRVSNPMEVVKPGDEITVKVLRVEEGTKKIALGLKQLQADPWSKVGEAYAVGGVHQGRVTRLADFGAFIELEPGVEALAHVSTFPPTGTQSGWKAAVPPGTTGAFEILSVDLEKKRIGVAIVPEGSVRAEGVEPAVSRPTPSRVEIVPGSRLTGKVERHERYGVFVFLAPGRTGLIPLAETGVAREGDVARAFPIGSDVEVVVLEVDPSGRRIRLSRKAVLDAVEKDEVREYRERKDEPRSESFGSLGDKLRDALRPKEE
jgi:small subunit ribosomal protein S1